MRKLLPGIVFAGALLTDVSFASAPGPLNIPAVATAPAKRAITVDDVMALRKVAALKASPDGRRYAVFVRQADVENNDYRSAWFVGDVRGD